MTNFLSWSWIMSFKSIMSFVRLNDRMEVKVMRRLLQNLKILVNVFRFKYLLVKVYYKSILGYMMFLYVTRIRLWKRQNWLSSCYGLLCVFRVHIISWHVTHLLWGISGGKDTYFSRKLHTLYWWPHVGKYDTD